MTASVPTAVALAAAPDLTFAVTGVAAERFAALPTLRFGVEIARGGGGPVSSITLTTAIRIDVARRRYDAAARRALTELFGVPERWGGSLHPLAWTRTTTQVPAFADRTTTELTVECGYDTELAVTKYLRAVRDGEVPLDFLFSGTVFFRSPEGLLRTARISWSKDASFPLPAALWHELTDRYSAGGTWLRLSRETFDRLDDHRARQVLGSPDAAVRHLLDHSGAP
ncbi:DUF6084 family protein [Streptomyces sp. SAJ15]|uniref:DUF6084 family protein n=1 Tax=Streptomyces sp. SAJ15 TaxID=2011095 RepID=UPI001C8FAFAF|nr:DUF6084 family protein [Streptomyces sp. SAJ15]